MDSRMRRRLQHWPPRATVFKLLVCPIVVGLYDRERGPPRGLGGLSRSSDHGRRLLVRARLPPANSRSARR